MNPYLIEGPAQISFSGGRSSAYMLCKMVDANGGYLPDGVITTFANTGKEREETLRFVQRVSDHTGVVIHWIEYDPKEGPWKMGATAMDRWKKVDFDTAARNGEPFDEMVRRNNRPPTVIDRLCTAYLKTKPMEGYMKHRGYSDYLRVIGIRADEPRRVARLRGREDINVALPLADANVQVGHVLDYWRRMPFDLELPSVNGETIGGNCDLCYLKGTQKLLHLIRAEPSRADWWIAQEAGGKLFRIDRPNYATLKLLATQPQLFDAEEAEDAQPCECTD